MILYNPKEWWRIIFSFHKSGAFRLMTPGIIGVAIYTGLVAYIENDVLQVNFKNTTAIHSLVGFVLSLLLVFRTNTAYDRWWSGRILWGSINNDSRGLAIKISAMIENKNDRKLFETLITNFPFALKNHLRGKIDFSELIEIEPYTRDYYSKCQNIPTKMMANIVDEINILYKSGKISGEQLLFVQENINSLVNTIGACERIKNTPIPFSYNMFIKKVIFLYVFTMPIGFVREFGYWAMPIVASIFYVFASIELIAEEIEDPFGEDENDLPLEQISINLRKVVEEVFYK